MSICIGFIVCQKINAQNKCSDNQEGLAHFNINLTRSFRNETPRLDFVSGFLKACPTKIVILAAFAPSKVMAMRRLKKSQIYLLKNHNISKKKINIIYAGKSPELMMYIFFEESEPIKDSTDM